MIILRQKEFGYVSPDRAKQFFTKVGNPKGINSLQQVSKIPVAEVGGNPITKGNLSKDKKNYKIRNFRFQNSITTDPLQRKQWKKNFMDSLIKGAKNPKAVGIF